MASVELLQFVEDRLVQSNHRQGGSSDKSLCIIIMYCCHAL